jgi:hypothetical protein
MHDAHALERINEVLTDAKVTEAGVEPWDVVERVKWLVGLWQESEIKLRGWIPSGVTEEKWSTLTEMAQLRYWAWRYSAGEPGLNCYGCGKVDRHHARGEAGTVCMAHDFGPSWPTDEAIAADKERMAEAAPRILQRDIERRSFIQECREQMDALNWAAIDGGEILNRADFERIAGVRAALKALDDG